MAIYFIYIFTIILYIIYIHKQYSYKLDRRQFEITTEQIDELERLIIAWVGDYER